VAQKDAPAHVLAPFAAAFAADYGLALGTMAQRFEQRLMDRDQALREALAQLETHTIDSKVRVAGAESALQALAQALQAQTEGLQALSQTVQAQAQAQAARLDAAEAFGQQATAQRQQAEQHIAALLASSSWRLTAPWRLAGHLVKRARAGVKPGVKGALVALARAALRRPSVKRAARAVLARLQAMLHQAAQSQAMPPEPPAPLGDMTPRTLRVYRDLQTALKRKKH